MFKRSGLLIMVALFSVVGVAMAQEEAKTEITGAVVEATVPAVVNVGNKVCPVSGVKIEKLGENTVEYQGKIYNLCNSAGKDEFLQDPDKYVAKVAEEMAKEQAVPAVQVQQ